MAFSTLATIRTSRLNPLLGITNDALTEPWGSTTDRNAALQDAFQRLWPEMARLREESFNSGGGNVTTYVLNTIRNVEAIQIRQLATGQIVGEVKNFRDWTDEAADPPIYTVQFAGSYLATTGFTAIGYSPYVVPAGDGSFCDLPPDKEWIVVAGARAYIYLRALNQFMNTGAFQTSNRANAITPAELLTMQTAAEAQFQNGMHNNARSLRLPKSARLRYKPIG